MRHILASALFTTMVACGGVTGSAEQSGAPSDAANEAGLPDGHEEGGGGPIDTGPPAFPSCTTPVSGTAPFATVLSGTALSGDGGTVTVSVEAYFPKGRVAGGEVIVALPQMGVPNVRAISRGVFDASLRSTTLDVFARWCGGGIKGVLREPADGLVGHGSMNISGPGTDVVATTEADMMLCPVASPALPTPTFKATTEMLSTGVLEVTGNVPLDAASLTALTSTPTHPLTTSEDGTAFKTTVKMGPFESASIDLSGLKDVMGRSLGLSSVAVRGLSAVLTDTTFATTPPAGSVVGAGDTTWSVAGGVLRVSSSAGAPFSAFVGLGDAGTHRTLRVKHRVDCTGFAGSTSTTTVRAVSETGTAVAVAVECKTSPTEVKVTLPTGGRWALEAAATVYSALPCNYPSSSGPTRPYELDEFAFE